MLLWYNMMPEIPGVRNSSDFAHISPVVYRYENQFIDIPAVLDYI